MSGADWASAAGGPIGAGIGAYAQYSAQRKANQANREQARDMMRWQQMMSSTSHQREVTDLRAAGLNPILSAAGGGSSTPSGAMIPARSTGEGFAASAQSMVRLGADLKAIRANTKLAETKNTRQELDNIPAATTAYRALLRNKAERAFEKKYPGVMGASDAVLQRVGKVMPAVGVMTGLGRRRGFSPGKGLRKRKMRKGFTDGSGSGEVTY